MTFEDIEREGFHLSYAEVMDVINAYCSCGGAYSRDPGACTACQIWHSLVAAMMDKQKLTSESAFIGTGRQV